MSEMRMDSGMAKNRASGTMMEQRVDELSQQPAVRQPYYRRLAWWRAVAGMAFAIALACLVVALENASQFSSSSTHYHHRLQFLSSRIEQMRTELAKAQQQLSAMRTERDVRDNMNRILQSSDAVVLHLGADAGSHNSSGLVAISKRAGKAVLEVAGLPPSSTAWYAMWWLRADGPPVRAAQFRTDSDGRAAVRVQMPPARPPVVGSMITQERDSAATRPAGPIVLKGGLPGGGNAAPELMRSDRPGH